MNKKRLGVKIIIVVIPIINNMNADLVIHQNLLYFEIDRLRVDINENRHMVGQRLDHQLVDINEENLMVEQREVIQNLHHHKDHLEARVSLDIGKL